MKVFISWSGESSRAVAEALRNWIPYILPFAKPWISGDIRAGARWNREIDDELAQTNFGIICLTQENQLKPWILFEAGALAKSLERTFLVPYLIGINSSDVMEPLNLFQATRCDRTGTFKLIESINEALGKDTRPLEEVKVVFDALWPQLEPKLENAVRSLPDLGEPSKTKRSTEDVLKDLLPQLIEEGVSAALNLHSAEVSQLDTSTNDQRISDEDRVRQIAHTVSETGMFEGSRRLSGALVLWVDDNPQNNVFERRALESVGIRVTNSTSTSDALQKISTTRYDVIISDMGRREEGGYADTAGYTLLDKLRGSNISTPFIIYAGSNEPKHKAEANRRGAQGSTNNPQELFQLVTSAITNTIPNF